MKLAALCLMAWGVAASPSSVAQIEFPPPAGKGHALVAVSGAMGSPAYTPAAKKLASLGYDVFLLDGNDLVGDKGAGLEAAIDKARQSPNALPGKVAAVGFSLGGGQALAYAPSWPDKVAVVVVMYPLTRVYKDVEATVKRIKVPVLMFAGEADEYKDCCRIERAREIAAVAAANHIPLELVTYPGVGHDFMLEGRGFNARAAADAWARTEAKLKQSFIEQP
jgi:pimeloyl-ACP methyl ester carboxylesterase